MSVLVDNKPRRLGLALSGGGFRAAAFHLGVFRKLRALGLLEKVDALSCVSGGSIAGAFLAANWGSPDVLDRLDEYLRTKSIAISSVLGGILDPFHTRLDKLAATYDRDLFAGATLDHLANGPRIYLNATNLATGNLFFFVAGGGKPSELGEHELSTALAPTFLVSRAVAASSAFPPVFPPLRLTAAEYPPAGQVEYVTLSDGGIYDNMGVGPLLRARNEIDYLIVSDGGKPFHNDERPTESGAMVLAHSINILMEQVRGLEFDRMEYRHKAKAGPKPMWFSIDSHQGELQAGDAEAASAVGTNLKRLNVQEIAVLTRHGGALVEARLRKFAPEILQ